MSKKNDTGRGSGSTWRPSAHHQSSRAFTGSFTRPSAGPRTARARSRPRLRMAPTLIVLLTVLGVGLWLGFYRQLRPASLVAPAAVVELVRGPAQMVLADGSGVRRLALRSGMEIPAQATLEVSNEAGSGLAVRLAGGSSVRFEHGSRASLSAPDRLDLEGGALYLDSRSGIGADATDGEPVEVRTSFGLVRDIGTQFEVRLVGADEASPDSELNEDGDSFQGLRIRVREGRIEFTETSGERHEASAGEELRLTPRGAVERAPVAIHGRHWQWVLATAAVPDVEGQPLSLYLDWLEREGGWTLFYGSGSRAMAGATTLFGTIDGLSAAEATPMVFAGSGLTYRIEGEQLLISQRSQ